MGQQVYVLFVNVVEGGGTAITTTHRLSDPTLSWKIGDRISIPLSSGEQTVAKLTGMQFWRTDTGPDHTHLMLEFRDVFLRNVEPGSQLVNLDDSAHSK